MNIGQWLEDVRQKPHAVRTRYMWVSASAIIVVVFSFWVASVKHELKAVFERGREADALTALAGSNIESTAPSLFEALGASIDDFMAIFKGVPAAIEDSAVGQIDSKTPSEPLDAETEETKQLGPRFLPGTTKNP